MTETYDIRQCEHITAPASPGRGRVSHRCTRIARWEVTFRIFTGAAFTKVFCTQHAKVQSRIVASHPIEVAR